MRMSEISLSGRLPVESYGPGGFRIDGAWQAGSLVCSINRRRQILPRPRKVN